MPKFTNFKKTKTEWEEIVDFLIADENEAIDGYDQAIKYIDNADFIDDEIKRKYLEKLGHIKSEELEHILELKKMFGLKEN